MGPVRCFPLCNVNSRLYRVTLLLLDQFAGFIEKLPSSTGLSQVVILTFDEKVSVGMPRFVIANLCAMLVGVLGPGQSIGIKSSG